MTPANQPNNSPIKRIIHALVNYVLPMGLSVWLIIIFFKEVNLKEVWEIVKHGCNFWVILLMMVFVVTAMVFRGLRWGIQLRSVGIKRMPPLNECCAIFGAFALNIIFPRLGEAWRCVYVSRRQKSPLMTVVGTDLGDRTSDMICVFIFLFLSFLFEKGIMNEFLKKYALGRSLDDIFGHVWLWVGFAVAIAVLVIVLTVFKKYAWVQGMRKGIEHMWQGFIILFHMPQWGLYLWLTLGLWVSYFLQTYVCFWAFPFTESLTTDPGMALGLRPGLICLLFGVCSSIVPSNGGLGPWTIAVAYAVELFGVSRTDAAAYALVVWGFQSVIIVVMGIFTAFYLMWEKRNVQKVTS